MTTRPSGTTGASAAGGDPDLESCDREPIHLLGAVQGFGFLLAAGPDGAVRHASANVADHLGLPAAEMVGRPLPSLLQREAMHEITGPIMAITLVLSSVFLPCCFLGGVTGQFFRQFAVTIAVSTIISAINAITMTPSRAAVIHSLQ